jgi:hypothetical protein
MKVHPFADRWPMMSADELNDLAADIKANGLHYPIVKTLIDGEDVLIDGRNRFKACEIAGVEPRWQILNGGDPVAFIISSNAARRQMMKGALAMVVATEYPEVPKVGRGQKVPVTETFPMISPARLSEARTVIEYASDLVNRVITSAMSLDKAYEIALERKSVNESEAAKREKAAEADEVKMSRLVAEAPDLADRVKEDGFVLDEAIAALNERLRQRQIACEAARRAAASLAADFRTNTMIIIAGVEGGELGLLQISDLDQMMSDIELLRSKLT